jgi:hypothetical protein
LIDGNPNNTKKKKKKEREKKDVQKNTKKNFRNTTKQLEHRGGGSARRRVEDTYWQVRLTHQFYYFNCHCVQRRLKERFLKTIPI